MPGDFDDLLSDLKILKKAEEEAEKIVEDANIEAEKTLRDAEEQAASVMSEIETEIRKAARDLREQANADTKSEIDSLEDNFIQEAKKVRNMASEKMTEAVSYVVKHVLETEV